MTGNIPNQAQKHKIVQYTDGSLALAYRTRDDLVVLGKDSLHKYSRNLTDGSDLAMITTESGNRYFIGNGVILNKKTGRFSELTGQDTFNITIGNRAILTSSTSDNFWRTTPVTGVYLAYKLAPQNSPLADEQIPTTNPMLENSAMLRDLKQLFTQTGLNR